MDCWPWLRKQTIPCAYVWYSFGGILCCHAKRWCQPISEPATDRASGIGSSGVGSPLPRGCVGFYAPWMINWINHMNGLTYMTDWLDWRQTTDKPECLVLSPECHVMSWLSVLYLSMAVYCLCMFSCLIIWIIWFESNQYISEIWLVSLRISYHNQFHQGSQTSFLEMLSKITDVPQLHSFVVVVQAGRCGGLWCFILFMFMFMFAGWFTTVWLYDHLIYVLVTAPSKINFNIMNLHLYNEWFEWW